MTTLSRKLRFFHLAPRVVLKESAVFARFGLALGLATSLFFAESIRRKPFGGINL